MKLNDIKIGMKAQVNLGRKFSRSIAEATVTDIEVVPCGDGEATLVVVVPTKVIKDNTVDGSLTSIVGTGYRILVGLDKIIKEVV